MPDTTKLKHLVRNTLPVQIRHSFIRRPWYTPAKTDDGFGVKPKHDTGLWTSTYLPSEEPCCSWLRFVLNEMSGGWWENKWRYGYLYEVAKDLKILEINSQEDLRAINDVYGYDDWCSVKCNREHQGHPIHRWPDWGKIGRDFDAVHLTEAGQWATRMPHDNSIPYGSDNLYGWDCESTCWLRLHRRSLRFAGKIRLQYQRFTRQQMRDQKTIQRLGWDRMRETLFTPAAISQMAEDIDKLMAPLTESQ